MTEKADQEIRPANRLPAELADELKRSYDAQALARDATPKAPWKIVERDRFMEELQRRRAQSLLEVGSGPGQDGLYFQEGGLSVVCVDLSPEMVRLCCGKGLEAYERDVLNLQFSERRFDAVYSLNSLLHLPKALLPLALREIHRVLAPGGLFYFGMYGGQDWEGIYREDSYEPKRFFSFSLDHQLIGVCGELFGLVYFRSIEVVPSRGLSFYSMMWRKRGDESKGDQASGSCDAAP